MILDRISTRRVILTTLLICSLGTLLFGMATSVYIAQICRFFTGIGSAFCFLSSMRLASRWFPTQQLALVTGLVVTMAWMGGMVAQTPLTLLIEKLGWRHALAVDAGLGLIIWGFIYLFVQDYPPGQTEFYQQEKIRLQNWDFGTVFVLLISDYKIGYVLFILQHWIYQLLY